MSLLNVWIFSSNLFSSKCVSWVVGCYYVIWKIKYWPIEHCYHRHLERLIRKKILDIHRLYLIVILLIQSRNSQAKVSSSLPQAILTNWHLVFFFILFSSASRLLLSLHFLPQGEQQVVIVDDSISNSSPYWRNSDDHCTRAYARVQHLPRRKEKHESVIFWFQAPIRLNSVTERRKRLFIFHLTLEIIIHNEERIWWLETKWTAKIKT